MYASHTTLRNILRSPYEAPLVFPVHCCMLHKPYIPIHHYNSPQKHCMETPMVYKVYGNLMLYLWSLCERHCQSTKYACRMHIGLQRTISSQCRRYSHCTSCMYSAVRTKHPLIQPECWPSMLQHLSFYSTLLLHSSYITH